MWTGEAGIELYRALLRVLGASGLDLARDNHLVEPLILDAPLQYGPVRTLCKRLIRVL